MTMITNTVGRTCAAFITLAAFAAFGAADERTTGLLMSQAFVENAVDSATGKDSTLKVWFSVNEELPTYCNKGAKFKRIRFSPVAIPASATSDAKPEWWLTVEEPDGRKVEVTSAAPRDDIEVVLEPKETPDGVTFSGRVTNNGKGRITAFEGPIFKGLRVDKARSGIYVPDGYGRRISNFFDVEGADDSRGWKAEGDVLRQETSLYPSKGLTMPWVAMDDGKSGAAVMVLDPDAAAKRFTLLSSPTLGTVAIAPKHLFFLDHGQTWTLPAVRFLRYEGDWHVAAREYRAWYDKTHKTGIFPAWTKQVDGWLLVILKQQNEEIFWPYGDFDKLADYADELGIDMIGLFGWTVGGHDHLYPDYDPCPKMGGRDGLVEGIKLLKKRGKRVCLYVNGQLQQVGATRYWNEYGKDNSLVRRNGKPVVHHYHKYRDIPDYDLALACLYSKPGLKGCAPSRTRRRI